jgi:metal-responsive CopG/Arc/MetJ family transcriptional regulator
MDKKRNEQKDEIEKVLVSLPAPLVAKVKEINRKTGIPVSTIVKQALQGNLKQYEKIAEQVGEIVGQS